MNVLKIVALAAITLLTGCALQFVPVVKPVSKDFSFSLDFQPKFTFKSDTNTILVINRVDINRQGLNARNLRSVKAGAFTALKYAGEQLDSLPHVHVINLIDSTAFGVNTDSIPALVAKYHADYTLALTAYNADVLLDGLYDSGAYYNHQVTVKFTMYVGNGRLYNDLSGTDMIQSVEPNLGLVASLFVHPTVGGNKDKVIDATKNAVFNALLDYLPHTENINRPLYFNDVLEPSVNEILAGNFDKAYDLSQPLIQNPDSLLACKAAYNLAVVYTAQGDIDDALGMTRLSLNKRKNAFATDLLTYLKSK